MRANGANTRVYIHDGIFENNIVAAPAGATNQGGAIAVEGGATLTINGSGSLTAWGSSGGGAAIGGSYGLGGGTITIGGEAVINATLSWSADSSFGAVIGGGYNGDGGTITIRDNAVVNVNSGGTFAGIGGGNNGHRGTITIIDDAEVTASAIGASWGGHGGTINIGGSATVATHFGIVGDTITIDGSAVVNSPIGIQSPPLHPDTVNIGGNAEVTGQILADAVTIDGNATTTGPITANTTTIEDNAVVNATSITLPLHPLHFAFSGVINIGGSAKVTADRISILGPLRGTINIGDDADVTVVSNSTDFAISSGSGTITINGNAVVEATNTATALFSNAISGANINIGGNAKVLATSENGSAITGTGTVTIGDNADVTATGSISAIDAHYGATFSVVIQGDATVTASVNGRNHSFRSTGIRAAAVTIGGNSVVSVTHDDNSNGSGAGIWSTESGNITIDDNAVVTVTSNNNLAIGNISSLTTTITIGGSANVTVTSASTGIHGTVNIGDNAVVTAMGSAANFSRGIQGNAITIDGSANVTATGNTAIFVNGNGILTIGDDATVEATSVNTSGIAIAHAGGSTLNIGGSASVTATGYTGISFTNNGTLIIGDNADVTATATGNGTTGVSATTFNFTSGVFQAQGTSRALNVTGTFTLPALYTWTASTNFDGSNPTTGSFPGAAFVNTATTRFARIEIAPPTHSILLSPSGNINFGSALEGYSAVTPHTITINNTGNVPTGQLTATLLGWNYSNFSLNGTAGGSPIQIPSIPALGNASFTVSPVNGLTADTYTATITVSGGPDITQRSFNVIFNVSSVTGVTVSPGNASVYRGSTQQFTANVLGENNPPQGVTWSIDGITSSPVTHITQYGVLHVAPNETATSLTIRATSTANTAISGTATVTITNDPTNSATIGGQSVGLTQNMNGLGWDWNASSRTLTLNGSISGDINFAANEHVYVDVTGFNVSAERIINTGTGGVTITSNTNRNLTLNAASGPAISSNGSIVISSGVVNASTTAPNTPAVVSNTGSVTISGTADVTAKTLNGNAPAIRAAIYITISTNVGVEAHANTGNSLEAMGATGINITNGTTRLYFNAGNGAGAFSIAPAISGNNTRAYANGIQIFPLVAPTITGPTAKTLQLGYAATYTEKFTVTGALTPEVTVDTTHGELITWNDTYNRLEIAAGLAAGTYPVVLTVDNGIQPNATLTFTLTVSAAPVPVIEITTQPAPDTAVTFGSITGVLNVSASVTPNQALTYRWYRNNTNANTGGTFTGVTGTSFFIPTNLTIGTHYFYVVVTSPGATPVRSSVARVTVNPAFVPVANITGIPSTATVGVPLTLSGVVAPFNATNRDITWSVFNAGTTGATVNGNTFNATAAGTAIVRATITNGAAGADFTQNFTITVTQGQGNDDGNNDDQQHGDNGGGNNDDQQSGGNGNNNGGGNNGGGQQPGGNNNDNQQPGGGNGGGGGCNITGNIFAMLLVLPLVLRRKK